MKDYQYFVLMSMVLGVNVGLNSYVPLKIGFGVLQLSALVYAIYRSFMDGRKQMKELDIELKKLEALIASQNQMVVTSNSLPFTQNN